MRSDPPAGFSGVRPGFYIYSTGAIGYRGQDGFVWASSVGASGTGYFLDFDDTVFGPGTYINNKGYGQQVRCVLRSS